MEGRGGSKVPFPRERGKFLLNGRIREKGEGDLHRDYQCFRRSTSTRTSVVGKPRHTIRSGKRRERKEKICTEKVKGDAKMGDKWQLKWKSTHARSPV